MHIGEYYEASLQYAKAYAKIPSADKEKRGEIAYKIGESNLRCNYSIKALAGYRNAARLKYTDTLTYYYLGEMERIGKDYKNAALNYEEFLKTKPPLSACKDVLQRQNGKCRVQAIPSEKTSNLIRGTMISALS